MEPNSVCELIRLLFTEKECNILNRRNNLLHKLYNDKVKHFSPRMLEIDCFSTVNHIFQKICQNEVEFNSARQLHICVHCGTEDIKYHQYVPVVSTQFDIKNVQMFIREIPFRKVTCKKCNSDVQVEINYNKIIYLETDVIDKSIEKRKTPYSDTPAVPINQVTSSIELDGWKFNLGGVIGHRGGGYGGSHFFLYAKRNNGNWERFDNLHAVDRRVNTNHPVEIIGLFYTFSEEESNNVFNT